MKKFFLVLLALIAPIQAGNVTWRGASSSAKTAANWVGGTLPATGDVWVLSSTENVALTVDSNFTNAGIAADAGYTATVSLQSYTITTTGDVNLGGATIDPGTSTVNITNTATVTTAGKSFYNFVCNAATKAITMVGKFRAAGNVTVTAGVPTFANLARDSIGGDYANNLTGTDTLSWNADSCWFGGSFTGNLRTKNDLARKYFYGTALCNMTTSGVTMNHMEIRGTDRTKQVKLIDRWHGRKTQVTTGTLNTNGMDFFADSFIVVQDSVATVLGDTISSRQITIGASAKPINGTPLLLYFGLALADTMRDSIAQSLGNLVVNKTGSNLTFANAGHYDTIQVINGSIAMNAATDTQYCKGLSIASTSTCVLTAPIVVTDSIYIAAGATVTYSGVGKIIKQTCSAAQGGNAARIYYPTIAPVSYAASPWIDSVGVPSAHSVTITGCSLGKDSITNITALPTGYTINKTSGLISWDGTGSGQAASNYIVRAYGNAKSDSGSVTISMRIYPVSASSHRRNGGVLNCGLIIGTD